MIVKIKTFSGETLYLPEEDYLDELMYSDKEEEKKSKKSSNKKKLAAGLGAAGLTVAGGTIGHHLGKKKDVSVHKAYVEEELKKNKEAFEKLVKESQIKSKALKNSIKQHNKNIEVLGQKGRDYMKAGKPLDSIGMAYQITSEKLGQKWGKRDLENLQRDTKREFHDSVARKKYLMNLKPKKHNRMKGAMAGAAIGAGLSAAAYGGYKLHKKQKNKDKE